MRRRNTSEAATGESTDVKTRTHLRELL